MRTYNLIYIRLCNLQLKTHKYGRDGEREAIGVEGEREKKDAQNRESGNG